MSSYVAVGSPSLNSLQQQRRPITSIVVQSHDASMTYATVEYGTAEDEEDADRREIVQRNLNSSAATPSSSLSTAIIPSYRLSPTNCAILCSTICGSIFGYTTVIISGISDSLINSYFFPLSSPSTQNLYCGLWNSCILFGCIVGCFGGVPFAAKYGYRAAYGVMGLICTVFSIAMALVNHSFILLVMFRILLGISTGMSVALAPLYATLVVPIPSQGRVGTVIQISICFFVIVAECVNYVFNLSSDEVIQPWTWKAQFAIGAISGVVMICCVPLIREVEECEDINVPPAASTSGGLISSSTEDLERASSLIAQLQVPLNSSSTSISSTSSSSPSSFPSPPTLGLSHLFTAPYRHSLFISILLAAIDQLTGINAFILYAPRILRSAGLSPTEVTLCTILLVGVWNLLCALFVMSLIDRYGRKTLMLSGTCVMAVACGMMSAAYMCGGGSAATILAIGAMVVFFFGFGLGPGSLFFLLAAESFPVEIRDSALSFTQGIWWIFNIIVVFAFPIAQDSLSTQWTFGIFAAICVVTVLLTAIGAKETKPELIEAEEQKEAEKNANLY